MPIFARIDVRLANTADNTAYKNQLLLLLFPVDSFFVIIRNVPAKMSTIARIIFLVSASCRMITARIIVSTVLDLSIGVTLFTSPSCSALK